MSMTLRSVVNGRGQDDLSIVTAAPVAAGTYTPDMYLGNRFIVTMPAGNITIGAPTHARLGLILDIEIVQDGVGSRTVTWNAIFKFAGATGPTLTTTASRRDTFRFVFNGTNWEETARTLNIG